MATFVVYRNETADPRSPLIPCGEIESRKRELYRKLRQRAIAADPELQQLASSEDGVRVVLVEADRVDDEALPLKGSTKFTFA